MRPNKSKLQLMGIQQWRRQAGFSEPFTHAVSSSADSNIDNRLVTDAAVDGAVDQPGTSPSIVAADGQAPTSSSSMPDAVAEGLPDPIGRDLSGLNWQDLQSLIESDKNCPSCSASNSFLGEGAADADWMFIIDAPISREVEVQALLLGRAGQLFDSILSVLGLQRSTIYLSSVFKCAPTSDLSATPQCDELVHQQIALVQPKVVVTFGEFAAQAVIKTNEPIEVLRAQPQRCYRTNTNIVPTLSPKEMLDDPSLKAAVWHDLKLALRFATNT